MNEVRLRRVTLLIKGFEALIVYVFAALLMQNEIQTFAYSEITWGSGAQVALFAVGIFTVFGILLIFSTFYKIAFHIFALLEMSFIALIINFTFGPYALMEGYVFLIGITVSPYLIYYINRIKIRNRGKST